MLGDGSMCSRRPAEVLDFVIKVLREHERWLDGFAKELKAIVDRLGRLEPKRAETVEGMPVFRCRTWGEFKEKGRKAESVYISRKGKGLTISAVSNGKVYRYVLEPSGIRSWLSWLLNVPEEKISEGRLVTGDAGK